MLSAKGRRAGAACRGLLARLGPATAMPSTTPTGCWWMTRRSSARAGAAGRDARRKLRIGLAVIGVSAPQRMARRRKTERSLQLDARPTPGRRQATQGRAGRRGSGRTDACARVRINHNRASPKRTSCNSNASMPGSAPAAATGNMAVRSPILKKIMKISASASPPPSRSRLPRVPIPPSTRTLRDSLNTSSRRALLEIR